MCFPTGHLAKMCRYGLNYLIKIENNIQKCGELINRNVNEWWWCSLRSPGWAVWYIATSHITGNWTLKPTEERTRAWPSGVCTSRGTTAFQLHHISWAAALYPEFFVVWSTSRGLHKHISFFYTLLEFLRWCWSRCHVELLFSFAGMFSVWML